MRRLSLKFLLLCAAIFQVYTTFGQFSNRIHEQLRFNYLTIDQGLNDNRASALCQDNYGFIWIGTKRGMARFDGYDLKQYGQFRDDTTLFDIGDIKDIILDSHNNLWALGSKGISYFSWEDDVFVKFTPDGIHQEIYSSLGAAEDKNGNVWFGTNTGLLRYNLIDKSSILYSHEEGNSNSLEEGVINKICVSQKNHVWYAFQRDGAGYLDLETMEFHNFQNSSDTNSLAEDKNERVFEDKSGTIWIGHNNNGISKYSYETGNFKNYYPEEGNDLTGRVRGIAEDEQGNFWLGTRAGMFLFDRDNEIFKKYAYTDHPISTISHNSVMDIMVDNQQGLWLGTFAGGVSYTNLNTSGFVKYQSSTIPSNYFLNDKSIYGFAFDKDDNIWIGTEGGGVNFLNRATGKFTYFKHDSDDPNTLKVDNIKDICVDDEKVWIGTYRGGLSCYNLDTKKFKHYLKTPEYPQGFEDVTIYVVYQDPVDPDILWLGTSGATDRLVTFNKKTEVFKHIASGVEGYTNAPDFDRIWSIAQTEDNKLVFAASQLMAILDNDTKDFQVFNSINDVNINNTNFVFSDRNGDVWAGINGHMLAKLDMQNNEFTLIDQEDGLPQVEFFEGTDDAEGNIWLSSNLGIWKLENIVTHPDNFNAIQYTNSDNLQSLQFNYHSKEVSPSGEILFGGINGFNAFVPEDVKPNPYVPNVIVTKFSVLGKEVKVGEKVSGKVLLKEPIMETKRIRIHSKIKIFTFDFTGFHYVSPEDNQFKYMLEGYDEEWQYTDANIRKATYSNLPRGKYAFKVDASNNNGQFSGKPFVIALKVIPPFWLRIWFFLIAAVILGAIIYSFVKRREWELKRDKDILEEKLKQGEEEISLNKAEVAKQAEALKQRDITEKVQRWKNKGLITISEIINKHKNNPAELAKFFLSGTVEYLEAQQGAIYILNDSQEEMELELVSGYALPFKDLKTRNVKIGESLVGACYVDKQSKIVDNIPDDYIKIGSGLGATKAKNIVLVPLQSDQEVIGILEVSSINTIEQHVIELLENIGGTFAINMISSKTSEKMKLLLDNSQQQAEEMKAQEEELRQNLEEMQATSENAERREQELIKLNEEMQAAKQSFQKAIKEKEKALAKTEEAIQKKEKEIELLKSALEKK